MVVMVWMPEEPVPIMPTRLPERSTPSVGHVAVLSVRPVKLPAPGMSGVLAADRQPVAMTQNRAL